MKFALNPRIQKLILAAALSTGLGFVTPIAHAQHSYFIDLNSKTITDLGTLGGSNAIANGINDAGQVVGFSNVDWKSSDSRAFITGPNGIGMTNLGSLGGQTSYAYGINDAGQVVGYSSTRLGLDDKHAFITGPNGSGMTDLGGFEGKFGFSIAQGINGAGRVVGSPSERIRTIPLGNMLLSLVLTAWA